MQPLKFGFTAQDAWLGLPLVLLALGVLLVLALQVFSAGGAGRKRAAGWITILILSLAFVLTALRTGALYGLNNLYPERAGFTVSLFNKAYFLDTPQLLGHLVVLGAALFTAFLSLPFLKSGEDGGREGEYFALLLLMPLGGMLMVSGADLMVCFLGLEILSLSLYVLTAFRSRRPESVEAGIKYFMLGAFAAAFFVFGLALLYAGNGSIQVPAFRTQWFVPPEIHGIARLGGAMIFAALLFKASLFPFQMWTPDVYQGAPTPVTALMSTGTKAAAFVLMVSVAGLVPKEVRYAVPALAVLTMAAGNFGAIRQTDIKRLLAYSGIAHAGYILVGVNSVMAGTSWPDSQLGVRAVYIYLIVYALSNLGALGVVAWLERGEEKAVTLEGLKGLAARHPAAAALMALFLLSLGGIPPTAGFLGKLLVFSEAFRQHFYVLATLGLLLSAVSLYYYLKVVVYMYMRPAEAEEPFAPRPGLMALPIGASAAGVLLFGCVPSLLIDFLLYVNL